MGGNTMATRSGAQQWLIISRTSIQIWVVWCTTEGMMSSIERWLIRSSIQIWWYRFFPSRWGLGFFRREPPVVIFLAQLFSLESRHRSSPWLVSTRCWCYREEEKHRDTAILIFLLLSLSKWAWTAQCPIFEWGVDSFTHPPLAIVCITTTTDCRLVSN